MDRVKYMKGELQVPSRPVKPAHGDHWGRWTLNGEGEYWSLDTDGYYVPLHSIRTNAQMNDWVFQLAQKLWLTPEDLGHFVLALLDIFAPQATMCGEGQDKQLAPDFVEGVLGPPLGDLPEEESDDE